MRHDRMLMPSNGTTKLIMIGIRVADLNLKYFFFFIAFFMIFAYAIFICLVLWGGYT